MFRKRVLQIGLAALIAGLGLTLFPSHAKNTTNYQQNYIESTIQDKDFKLRTHRSSLEEALEEFRRDIEPIETESNIQVLREDHKITPDEDGYSTEKYEREIYDRRTGINVIDSVETENRSIPAFKIYDETTIKETKYPNGDRTYIKEDISVKDNADGYYDPESESQHEVHKEEWSFYESPQNKKIETLRKNTHNGKFQKSIQTLEDYDRFRANKFSTLEEETTEMLDDGTEFKRFFTYCKDDTGRIRRDISRFKYSDGYTEEVINIADAPCNPILAQP